MNFAIIDYRATHALTKGDLLRLQAMARQLVGEPLLFGALSYPRELTLHFGKIVEFKGPKGKVIVEGSYVLGAVGSVWRIKSASQGRAVADYVYPIDPRAVPQYISEAEVEKFLERLGGTIVRDVEVFTASDGYGLRIGMSDGSLVELFPTPDHFGEVDVNDVFPIPPPDWELFTPYKRYLAVGPGMQWAYLPSDESAKKGSEPAKKG